MKKKILFYSVIFIFFAVFPHAARALEEQPVSGPALLPDDIISETAVLMDAKTGQIIFDKNSDRIMFPASITKIMTGLLVAENCSMSEIAETTQSAVDIDVWDSANIALSPGERLPVDSLMYALMLPSANDAANVLAEHVAKTQESFVEMMNARAAKIGAASTHFANPHGLHDDNHYTTAHDLALITREAIKNPVFMQYFGAGTHVIPATNLQPQERSFTNYNYMLVSSTRFYNPSVAGGKVGYTLEAKHTMSTVAIQNGRTLICVVFSSPNRYDKFTDTQKLFDFGFGEFREITVEKETFPGFSTSIMDGETEVGTVKFTSSRDFTALVHNSADMSALKIGYSHGRPFEVGENVEAFAEFTVESENPAVPNLLGRVLLNADTSLFVQAASAVLHFKGDLTAEDKSGFKFSVPLALAAVAVVSAASLLAARQINLARVRKRRRQRMAKLQMEKRQPVQVRQHDGEALNQNAGTSATGRK